MMKKIVLGLLITSSAFAIGKVTNDTLANMAQSTIKGRAVSAGTGVPTDLTATQATAILNAFVGDSGSGGTKGLVPAPSSGDAAADKFVHADGTFKAAVTTVGSFGSSPDAKGASISGKTITMQPADATHPGAVSLSAQTLGDGIKTMPDELYLQNGTAANPSIAFASDTDTGIYRVGSNIIGIATEGEVRGYLQAWSSSNGVDLVLGDGASGQTIGIRSGNTSGRLHLSGGNGFDGGSILAHGSTHSTRAGFIDFYKDASRIALFDGSSNFGVGDITPASKLDVSGAITSRPKGTSSGDGGQISLRELAASGTNTATIRAPDTLSADITFTLPDTACNGLVTSTSGTLSCTSASGAPSSSQDLENASVSASVAANAITLALKQSDGSTNCASGSGVCLIGMRSATATSGAFNQRSVTGALSVVVSSGSTLGSVSGLENWLYVYAIDNSGTVELAVAGTRSIDCGKLVSTTAEGGAGAADSNTVLYSTTARSDVPCRLVGRVKSTQATAGTWATSPSEISTWPFELNALRSEIYLDTGNGSGGSSSGETLIRNYANIRSQVGSDITYTARTTTTGDKFTVNTPGIYFAACGESASGTGAGCGFSINDAAMSTAGQSSSYANGQRGVVYAVSGYAFMGAQMFYMNAGDILRVHQANASTDNASPAMTTFHMMKVAN